MLLAHTSSYAAMAMLCMDVLSKHWDAWRKRLPYICRRDPLDHLIFDSLCNHGYPLLYLCLTFKYSHTPRGPYTVNLVT